LRKEDKRLDIKEGKNVIYKIAKEDSEVKKDLKMMKIDKASGPDDISIEVWRCLRDVAIVWLTNLFNFIFRSNKIPDEWRRSILVPIFKNKGDVQSCVLITEELSS
jgi:hypothetical protein